MHHEKQYTDSSDRDSGRNACYSSGFAGKVMKRSRCLSYFVFHVFRERGESMEMKDLDNLQYAVQILSGIRGIMVLLESSTINTVPVSVYIVFETAIEKAVSLLEKAVCTMHGSAAEEKN